MRNTRIRAFALSLMLVIALLAGCQEAAPTQEKPEAITFDKEADGVIQIGWLFGDDVPGVNQQTLDTLTQSVNEALQRSGQTYQVEMQRGILPTEAKEYEVLASYDLIYAPTGVPSLTELQTYFMDLKGELTEGDLKPLYESMPASYWDTLTQQGAIYSSVRVAPPEIAGLWINPQLLETLGLSVPQELIGQPLSQWDSFFAQIYEANGGNPFMRNPFTLSDANAPILADFMWETQFQLVGDGLVIAYNEPEKGVQCLYESDYAKEMYALYARWGEAGYIYNDPAAMAGQAAVEVRPQEIYSLQAHQVTDAGLYGYPLQTVSYATNGKADTTQMLLVPNGVKDLDIVYSFLNALASNEELAQAACLNEMGQVQASFTPLAQVTTPMLLGAPVKTLAAGNEQEALRQQYEKLQAAPAPGFAFDASQAVDNWSEIEMAYTQFTSTLTSELGDLTNWSGYEAAMQQFVQQLYELGMDRVLEAANASLNA